MKRLEGSGSKVSYVVIKKFQLQLLKLFSLKSEGFHSWASSSVFLDLRTRYVHHSTQSCKTLQLQRNRHHYLQHKHTKILGLKGKRQISSVQTAERGSLVTVVNCMSQNGQFISPLLVFPKIYETRPDEWHTVPINPRVPSLWVEEWIQSEVFTQCFLHFIKHTKPTNYESLI